MKIGQPRLILDPYEWLPGYGESKVSFCSVGTDVVLTVEYERDVPSFGGAGAVQGLKRELVFKCVSYFMRTPFPINTFFEFVGDSDGFGLGELTEFLDSELVQVMSKARRSLPSGVALGMKHFSIQFLSENIAFHMVAEEVFLSDEELVL